MHAIRYDIFLAGPFFNEQQVMLCRDIYELLIDKGFKVFWSYEETGQTKIEDDADAWSLFYRNAEAVKESRMMLAIMDWLNMPGSKVVLQQLQDLRSSKETPLCIPDSGTVWECGMAYAMEKPVYLFTTRPRDRRVNIMLTQCSRGVIHGMEQLKKVLVCRSAAAQTGQPGPYIREAEIADWGGRHQ